MTASAIILVFSGLAAASSGAKGSVGGLLSMLSAMRYVAIIYCYLFQSDSPHCQLLPRHRIGGGISMWLRIRL